MKPQNRRWRVVRALLIGPALLVVAGVATVFTGLQVTALPPAINMSSTGDMSNMGDMGHMNMPPRSAHAQPVAPGTVTPLASLAGPLTATHTSAFTLIAAPARLTLGPGAVVDAWTYNGTAPGPTLRVHQGDLVVVTLTNHLPVGVTIHWHGVAVPNTADGVAGLTQDAVKPGESYTYRFIAKDAGTYWYHSHQQSLDQTTRGLFGLLVVEPAAPGGRQPAEPDAVDRAVALHTWSLGGSSANKVRTINDTSGTLRIPAQPGQWVRLRIANTGGDGLVTLLGAPFTVVALDGHDLNEPTPLVAVSLPVGEGQRYDIRFRMPESGSVTLVTGNSDGQYQATPAIVVGHELAGAGQGSVPNPLPAAATPQFDFAGYGSPEGVSQRADAITPQSHFDLAYTMTLNSYVGFWAGRLGQVWTLNGEAFPNTPAFVVAPGQLVKIHIVNAGTGVHPMHLHGHSFAVLARNGRPLTGSPVTLDTLLVEPRETYDIAFYADNPGLWMFHCHNLVHANWGMNTMVVYPHIATPYTIGPHRAIFRTDAAFSAIKCARRTSAKMSIPVALVVQGNYKNSGSSRVLSD